MRTLNKFSSIATVLQSCIPLSAETGAMPDTGDSCVCPAGFIPMYRVIHALKGLVPL